jgi:hypothetical protein
MYITFSDVSNEMLTSLFNRMQINQFTFQYIWKLIPLIEKIRQFDTLIKIKRKILCMYISYISKQLFGEFSLPIHFNVNQYGHKSINI